MEVVLINPKFGSTRRLPQVGDIGGREPTSLLAIGSYLKHFGCDVELVDTNLYPEKTVREKIEHLANSRPICFGFSVMTNQIPHALELSQLIKNLDPRVPIIWGGIHPTLFPSQTSLDPRVDFVVYGPGEATCLELVQRLARGEAEQQFEDIKGIAYRGKTTPPREVEDINALPFFDYDLLDIGRYLGPAPRYLLSDKPIRALNVLSSRGCPWRCAFCINNAIKNRWRPLSAERFLDELEYQVNKYKLDAVRVIDEDFFVNRRRVVAIVEGLQKRGIHITWGTNMRTGYFNGRTITLDLARQLKDVGLKFASMGAESGSNRVLEFLKKDISVEDTLNSASICNQAGIVPVYSWMCGIPTETKEEMKMTLSLIKKITEICPSVEHYRLQVYRPLPGGELYEWCRSKGLYEPSSTEDWKALVNRQSPIGDYPPSMRPWLDNHVFVESISTFTMKATGISRSRWLPSRVLTYFVSSCVKWWDHPVFGWPIQKVASTFLALSYFTRSLLRGWDYPALGWFARRATPLVRAITGQK